jgi:hypothetical protein
VTVIRIRLEGRTLDRTRLTESALHELVRGLAMAYQQSNADRTRDVEPGH